MKRRRWEGKTVLDHRTCGCGKYEFCRSCERTNFPWGRSMRADQVSVSVLNLSPRHCVCGRAFPLSA